MATPRTVIRVCPRGSAKNLIAAELARKLDARQRLPLRFTSAAMEPAAEILPQVIARLRGDGLDVSGDTPLAAIAAALLTRA